MSPNMAQSLVLDHIRESRQRAAARQASAARGSVRKARTHAARRGGRWLVRGA
jgi:hypothetical protein